LTVRRPIKTHLDRKRHQMFREITRQRSARRLIEEDLQA
jgi:hypothetical protein